MVTTTNISQGSTSMSPLNGVVTSSTPVASAESVVMSSSPTRRANENRRSNKPIMEKRRRARINNCLNELKTLILDAMKKDPARHSKLEKADILEMTVKHLQNLQRQQAAMSAAADPQVINKFRAGYSECAGEVGRFPGLDPVVRRRLLQHLATYLNQGTIKREGSPQQVQVILPNPSANEQAMQQAVQQVVAQQAVHAQSNSGIIFNNTGVQLVPTRLPNGDIALVLPTSAAPTSSQGSSSPLPLLVPIPSRTNSTSSAASTSSNYSPSESPEPREPYMKEGYHKETYQNSKDGYSKDTYSKDTYSKDTYSKDTYSKDGYSKDYPKEAYLRESYSREAYNYSPPMQKPLSLVIRKAHKPVVEDKPWRPW